MTLKPRSPYVCCSCSSPVYCGVRPHFDATLTSSSASPSWPARPGVVAAEGVDRVLEDRHGAQHAPWPTAARRAGYGPIAWGSRGHVTTASAPCRTAFAANFEPKDTASTTRARRWPSRSTASSSSTCGAAPPPATPGRALPWEPTRSSTSGRRRRRSARWRCLMLADQGRARPLRAGRHVLAGVRRRGQGRRRGAPRDEPHRRPVGLAGADHVRGPLRPPQGGRAARRPGAVVGAGHGVGLPRHHPGLPRGRDRAAGHRASRSASSSRENITGPLGADFHIGTPAVGRRPRRPRHPAAAAADARGPRPDQRARQDVRQPGARRHQVVGRRRGGGPRSRPPAATATPARSPRCTPRWRAAARPTACACSARRPSTPCSTSSATASTSCSASRCATASASACRSTGCRSSPNAAHLLLGRLGRLAGDHRPRRPDELQLRDEQDGRGHRRRHSRRQPARRRPTRRSPPAESGF